ncbi:hypothetical protein ZOSMA_1002G00010, partial [Zostera marina]
MIIFSFKGLYKDKL